MDIGAYLDTVATQLVNELQPILAIKGVAANTELLVNYTEAAIQGLVHRIVHPMRVCTGAVLDHPLPVQLRQIDIIVWAPFPAPALFDVNGFGLVPRSSAFGVIEVKHSNYRGIEGRLEGFFADVEARRIVSDPGAAFLEQTIFPGLGAICVLDKKPSAKLNAWISAERVIAIFEKTKHGADLRTRDVLVLVNFLHRVTWRYRVQGSAPSPPQLRTQP
jgi:hypothetical protein